MHDSGELFLELVSIMQRLRSENGCIWDREQTHQSIKKNLIEESYEALEAIEDKDYRGLKEELGDILLQVVFHSRIAEEENNFNINDVIKEIISKLIRRHPHVFGDKTVESSREVLTNWESIKKAERKGKNKESLSIFSNIPKILPSLHYAYEIQNRAARLGFDWDSIDGVFEKINEEISELWKVFSSAKRENLDNTNKKSELMEETGDLLFSIVNLTRHLKLDSEECLRYTCKKFIQRFDYMEKYCQGNGLDFASLSLPEKEKLWEIAKSQYLL
ncbi:MAG: nucleoside triphosphate pyrophosphohydrolase [Actinobacteria bacterium]|nr:nucleoside triphosphate pyrophosphohydrolase [Actinomycetota bacterium]